MAGFTDGFMKGYSFMETIDDNKRKREREDYTFARLKDENNRADKQQSAEDLNRLFDDLYTDSTGGRLSDEEVLKDPRLKKRLIDTMNLPRFKGLWTQGTGKDVASVTVDDLAVNPDNTVTPMVSQVGNDGNIISSGPLTNDRKAGKDDPNNQSSVLASTLTEGINKLKAYTAMYSPTYSANRKAEKKRAGQVSSLADVLPGERVVAPTDQTTNQPVGQTPTKPSSVVPSTPAPTDQTTGQTTEQPVVTEPKQPTVETTKSTSTSLQDRLAKFKERKPAGESGLAKLGRNIFNSRQGATVNYFDAATDPENSSTLAKNAVISMNNDPLKAAESFNKNRSVIEEKLGPKRAEQLRQDLMAMTQPQAGKADLTDRDKFKRISSVRKDLSVPSVDMSSMSTKSQRFIEKVKTTIPSDPKARNEQLKNDVDLLSKQTKVGASFSKQTTKNSRARKESVARLIVDGLITADQGDRILRTGRLTKGDIKQVSDSMGGFYNVDSQGNIVGRVKNQDKINLEKAKAISTGGKALTAAKKASTKAQKAQFDNFAKSLNPFWARTGDKGKYGRKDSYEAVINDIYQTVAKNPGKVVNDLGLSLDVSSWSTAQTSFFLEVYNKSRARDKADDAFIGNNGVDTRGQLDVSGISRYGETGNLYKLKGGGTIDLAASAKKMGVSPEYLKSKLDKQ